MRDTALYLICALALTAIVAGLLSVGGPGSARMDERDAERVRDLQELRYFVECIAASTDGTVPDSLDGSDICTRDLNRADPLTDTYYSYERLSDTAYRLCADFENPARAAEYFAIPLDSESGCVTWAYTP